VGPNFKEVGGGPATGLANSLIQLLQGGLTGNFGGVGVTGRTGPLDRVDQSDPTGRTLGIAGVLNDILSGGAGNLGGSLQKILAAQGTRDVADLRSRYTAGGGTSLGTPAAFAESLYRSEAAPRSAMAVGNLQLQALLPILQMITGLSGKGISQRQTVAQPSRLTSAIGTIAPIVGAASNFFAPGVGSALSALAPDTSGFDPSSLWGLELPKIPGY